MAAIHLQPNNTRAQSAAFTLVELLVSMTVLVLLVTAAAQLTNGAANVTTLSNKRLDADGQARTVFSRMAIDFDGMLLRKDVDCFFAKNTGNDAFYFYSEAPGFSTSGITGTATCPASFVGYRIANRATPDPDSPNGALERMGFGLFYNYPTNSTLNVVFLVRPAPTFAVPSPTPFLRTTLNVQSENMSAPNGTTWDDGPVSSTSYIQISPDVFRLEFCFLMKDGTSYVPPVPVGHIPWNTPDFIDAMLKIRTDAAAIVVTLAILDPKSRVIVSDITKIRDALKDTPADPTNYATVAKTWTDAINSSTFAKTAGIPASAAAQVHVYQRAFYLKSK